MKFIGYDKLFRKKPNKKIKFDIEFHLDQAQNNNENTK